jgi:uncharacterized protein (DUF2336 family)
MAATADQQAITVDDLRLLSAKPTAEVRAGFATKFGRQYDQLVGGGEGQLAEAIAGLLVKDSESMVRQALAEAIADCCNLSPGIAERLAHDQIEVARAILACSPALDDGTLIEILRQGEAAKGIAIAGRMPMSTAVIGALLDSGRPPVVGQLMDNHRVHIPERCLDRVIDEYGEHQPVVDRLMRRPGLPPTLVDRLTEMIGKQLHWDLVTYRAADPDDAAKLMTATRRQAERKLKPGDAEDRAMFVAMHERLASGDVGRSEVLTMLRDCEIREFEAALSLLARMELRLTRKLLYSADKRALALLCHRAGLGTPQYLVIRMALDLAEQGYNAASNKPIRYPSKTARFVQEQYDRLAKQPELIQKLLH